jgi:hypothetical protein
MENHEVMSHHIKLSVIKEIKIQITEMGLEV